MNTDHIIIDTPSGEARCLHCGDYHALTILPAKRFLAIVRGFLIMHEDCPKPAEPSRQTDLFDAQARANPEDTCKHDGFSHTRNLPCPRTDDAPPPDKFAELYPMARTTTDLCLLLALVLPLAKYPGNDAIAAWHPRSGIFDAVAHWARVEKASNDGEARAKAGEPSINGLTVPQRLPMPEALREALGIPVKKKKQGARPLTSKGARG